MNNIINQAAEDYRKNTKYVQGIGTIEQLQKIQDNQYRCIVDHWHSYLAAQGDEDIVDSILIADGHHPSAVRSPIYGEDRKHILQALAIGRASNRWIPITERLPEEKDATEISGIKVVETLVWHKDFKFWESFLLHWDNQWIRDKEPHYWRTPSTYPEPPKSEV